MGDYDVVIGVLAFLIISHLTLVEAQGAEHFFQGVNITEDQLSFTPDDPTPSFLNVDLEGEAVLDQANVTVVDTDTLNNTDYDTPEAVVLEQGEDRGFIAFNLPEARSVKTLSQKESVILQSRSRAEMPATGRTINLRGENTFNLEAEEDTVVIYFEPPVGLLGGFAKEPRLYDIQASRTGGDSGGFLSGIPVLGGLIDTIYGLITTPLRFWEVFTQFPFYFQAFYGGLILWMIADILQVG